MLAAARERAGRTGAEAHLLRCLAPLAEAGGSLGGARRGGRAARRDHRAGGVGLVPRRRRLPLRRAGLVAARRAGQGPGGARAAADRRPAAALAAHRGARPAWSTDGPRPRSAIAPRPASCSAARPSSARRTGCPACTVRPAPPWRRAERWTTLSTVGAGLSPAQISSASMRGRPLGAVGGHRPVVDRAVDLLGDRGGELFGLGVGVVDAARPAPCRSRRCRTWMFCSKWLPQRDVDERPPARGELHRRRQSTLDDGDVAGRQVPVQVGQVADAPRRRAARETDAGSMRGPATATIRSPGTARRGGRVGRDRPAQQVAADAGPADRHRQTRSSGW